MGVQLTDEEIWQFVADSHTGILTTIDREGFPVSLPTWHVVIDDRVYVRTREKAAKSRRIKAESRVSFLVESGEYWVDLKAVCLIGHAHHVADIELRTAVSTALDDKYGGFRKSRRELPSAVRQHYSQPEAIIAVVADRRTLSWDNRKIRSS